MPGAGEERGCADGMLERLGLGEVRVGDLVAPACEREHPEQAPDGVEADETRVDELRLVWGQQVVQLPRPLPVAQVAGDQRRAPHDAGPDLVLADGGEVSL